MKEKIIINKTRGITREEIEQNIKDNDGLCYFMIETEWNRTSYAHLNNLVEDAVEDGFALGDIDYTVMGMDEAKEHILILVCCSETEDYVEGNF